MKYVVLQKVEGDQAWTHIGAAEVGDEGPRAAITEVAVKPGVCVAVPYDDWMMFTVEAQVVVTPLPRQGEIEQDEETELEQMRQQHRGES